MNPLPMDYTILNLPVGTHTLVAIELEDDALLSQFENKKIYVEKVTIRAGEHTDFDIEF